MTTLILLGAFSWLNTTGWFRPAPTTTPRFAATPTPTSTMPTIVTETPVPVLPLVEHGSTTVVFTTETTPARITHTQLFPTAGGWAVTWLVHTDDLWEPSIPSELWYAHIGSPAVPATRLVDIHRIDRLPLYLAAASPDGTQLAIVVNELINWRTLRRGGPGRVTHQWFGRLNLDGSWALPLQKSKPIATNLGSHGGIGHMVWTGSVIRLATEAECQNAKHQCLYSQRLNPQTGAVLLRGSITKSNMGHQTAPQVIALDDRVSRLTTVSDGAGRYGGLMVYGDLTGGWPMALSFPFLLDFDPQSRWNGDAGMGRRIGTLWRQLRHNDHKLNSAGEPWRLRFVTWDLVRVGSAAPKVVVLSDSPLTEWSTLPGYQYGYPYNSRWNTALEHVPGGGWVYGAQLDGDYVVGRLTETGAPVWRSAVSPALDYAGDVAVRGEQIGYVTTRQTDDGVELIMGER